jgi:hypothetical protein
MRWALHYWKALVGLQGNKNFQGASAAKQGSLGNAVQSWQKKKQRICSNQNVRARKWLELCDVIAVFAVWSDLGLQSEAIKLMTVTN